MLQRTVKETLPPARNMYNPTLCPSRHRLPDRCWWWWARPSPTPLLLCSQCSWMGGRPSKRIHVPCHCNHFCQYLSINDTWVGEQWTQYTKYHGMKTSPCLCRRCSRSWRSKRRLQGRWAKCQLSLLRLWQGNSNISLLGHNTSPQPTQGLSTGIKAWL